MSYILSGCLISIALMSTGLRAAHRPADPWFETEVWNKVGERQCLKCHREKGDAADSRFLLEDPARTPARRREILAANLAAFHRMARMEASGRSRLLVKVANADAVQGIAQHPYHDDFVNEAINAALKEQFEERVATTRLPRVERAQGMLYTAQLNSAALQRVTPFVPKQPTRGRLEQQADIALASFRAGVCVSANLSIGQFDSHANNDRDQMKLIPEFLAGIDYLIRRAEELKIREQLVVVIQSEMGRTPNYNKGEGKDHWSIGSIMFLGRGIRGNRVLGATDEKQFLVPIDPRSLATAPENGVRLRPEHLHEALRELAGVAQHPSAKLFPLKVKPAEKLVGLWG